MLKEVDTTANTKSDNNISYISNKKVKRKAIGPDTFKDFIFGDDDVSEVSDSTPYSSFNHHIRLSQG